MDNAVPATAPERSAPGLRRDAIGLREVLFQLVHIDAPELEPVTEVGP